MKRYTYLAVWRRAADVARRDITPMTRTKMGLRPHFRATSADGVSPMLTTIPPGFTDPKLLTQRASNVRTYCTILRLPYSRLMTTNL